MIKALFAVFSARDIKEPMRIFEEIKCVDKAMFKYRDVHKNLEFIEKFFVEHKEYTHLILNSDDAMPTDEQIAMIIADVEKYDFPVIAGCCCEDKLHGDMRLNVTFLPITKVTETQDWRELDYKQLPQEFANRNMLMRVWFQGNSVMCIRRDVVEKVHLTYLDTLVKKYPYQPWFYGGDLAWAYVFSKIGIPQYVDFRCYMEHSRLDQRYGEGKVFKKGQKEPIDTFEKATIEIPKVEPAPLLDTIPEDLIAPLEKSYSTYVPFRSDLPRKDKSPRPHP